MAASIFNLESPHAMSNDRKMLWIRRAFYTIIGNLMEISFCRKIDAKTHSIFTLAVENFTFLLYTKNDEDRNTLVRGNLIKQILALTHTVCVHRNITHIDAAFYGINAGLHCVDNGG